jgi:hypothetical protein
VDLERIFSLLKSSFSLEKLVLVLGLLLVCFVSYYAIRRYLIYRLHYIFRRTEYKNEYVRRKKAELDAYNKEHSVDTSQVVNGRRMTNVGTFRAYVIAYLRNHPKIRQDLTFLQGGVFSLDSAF